MLVVDDHAMVRRGVQDFLTAQPGITVVAEAGSADEALRNVVEQAPDVALVDPTPAPLYRWTLYVVSW